MTSGQLWALSRYFIPSSVGRGTEGQLNAPLFNRGLIGVTTGAIIDRIRIDDILQTSAIKLGPFYLALFEGRPGRGFIYEYALQHRCQCDTNGHERQQTASQSHILAP